MDLTRGKKENGVGANGIILEINGMDAFALREEKNLVKIIVPMRISYFKVTVNIKQFHLKLNRFFRFQIKFIYAVNGDLLHIIILTAKTQSRYVLFK